MSNRRARIPVSLELLEHMLPAGTVIHGFTENEFYRTIEVIVSHPSFDELETGDPIPTRSLMVYRCPNFLQHKVQYAS